MMKFSDVIKKRCFTTFCILIITVSTANPSRFMVYAAEEETTDIPDWNMIDHIELSGGWERTFYDRLTEESAEDGALVDISKGNWNGGIGIYVIPIMEFSGTAVSPADVENQCVAKRDEETDQIDLVMLAFLYDHPEIFWVDPYLSMYNVSWQWWENNGRYTYHANIELILKDGENDIRYKEFRTPEAIKEGIKLRDEKADEILRQTEGMSDLDKIRFFDHHLTSINQYFTGNLEDYNAVPGSSRCCISALEGRTGLNGPVCSGYATAFKLLCDRSGIPCILIYGTGSSFDGSSEAHLWNSVCLDGNWYGTDVTWDDADFVFEDGSNLSSESQDYLLAGSESVIDRMTYGASHTAIEEVDYPVLSPTRYEVTPFPYTLEIDGQINGYYNLDNMQNGLKDLAKKAAPQTTILVNGSMEVEQSVLDSIKHKNITLCFQDEKNGMSWSVNGESVTKGYQTYNRISVRNLLFERSDLKKNIYAATGRRKFLHIKSNQPAEQALGYTAEISIHLNTENAGQYVTHFYYDARENKLEFVSSEQIPADGIIYFTTKTTVDDIFTVSSQPLDADCLP